MALLAVGLRALGGRVSGILTSGRPLKSAAAAVEMAPAAPGTKGVQGVEVVQNPLGSGSGAAAGGAPPAPAEQAAPQQLPSGWTECNDSIDTWYVGPNGETQWERPQAPQLAGIRVSAA